MDLYNTINELCNARNISMSILCKSTGISRSLMTELKMGRTKSLSSTTIAKIANYFDVSVDYILGKTEQKEKPSENGELPDKNIVTIIGRDGRYIQKKLTDEQIQALETIINQMPDAPDEI